MNKSPPNSTNVTKKALKCPSSTSAAVGSWAMCHHLPADYYSVTSSAAGNLDIASAVAGS